MSDLRDNPHLQSSQDMDSSSPTSPILSPEHAVFVLMSDHAGPVRAPPAHITASLRRRSLARRKSSATSSRRNSMTSSHSHHSGSTFRPRASSHSNHVAQHLRRASIIESRKARLADRAAHVEQVRMRAALAKSLPKASTTSSEERALAASISRQKNLAKVVAACAEEVQKAKQRAQDTKARKLEDEKKIRQDMEERFAEADKRRAEHQRSLHARRSRRASSMERKLAVVVEDSDMDVARDLATQTKPAIDRKTAAARIQRTWRLSKRRAIVNAYLEIDFSLDSIRTKPFDEVGLLMASPKVLRTVSDVLKLLRLHPPGTRSFLSAYLILTHPTAVMSRQGEQEQDLITKSRELLILFESAVSRLALWNRYLPSISQRDELSQAHLTYNVAFDAWKAEDVSALLDVMVATFVEFDAIWQSVKDDTRGHAADDYRQVIRDNQAILLSRIRKLAGAERADVLIKRSIRESRRRRGRRRTAAEVRPRAAEATAEQMELRFDPVALTVPVVDQVVVVGRQQDFPASFSPIPGNRQLTHELAINKDYRINAQDTQRDRDLLNRQLCDSMQVGIEQGEGALWTTAMAECIRGKLLGIMSPQNPYHNMISKVLDSDHIHTQCSQGVFSYDTFFEFMSTILPKLCAPFRDAEMLQLASDLVSQVGKTTTTAAMIEKLFRLLQGIDLLSLDHANFLVSSAAPVLIRESGGYERRTFDRDLQDGTHGLENTAKWWRQAQDELSAQSDRRDPEQVRLAADRPSSHAIHSRMLCNLAMSPTAVEQGWPETLELDRTRLAGMRREALDMTCIGAMLLTAKKLLKRDVRSTWKSEGNRLLALLHNSDDSSETLAQKAFGVIESAHNLPPATATTLQAACSRFVSQAKKTDGRPTDPVMRLVFQRLKSLVLERISVTSSHERVRAISTASESLARAGLPEFVAQVGDMVALLVRVKEVDWECHGKWYDEVARGDGLDA